MQVIDRIALILAIIGGLNWGSIGLFRFDLVAWICGGQASVVARVIYTLVGLAAIWCISLLFPGSEKRHGRRHAVFFSSENRFAGFSLESVTPAAASPMRCCPGSGRTHRAAADTLPSRAPARRRAGRRAC